MPRHVLARRMLFTGLLGLVAAPVSAQSADTLGAVRTAHDSSSVVAREPAPWLSRRDALAFGVAIAATVTVSPLDRPVFNEFDEPQWRQSRQIRHVTADVASLGGDGPFVASALVLAVGAVGGGTGLRSFAIHNMESIALATVITGITKGIAGRALPGVATKHSFELGRGFHDANGPFVSFPSGHTAAAFAMAATVSGELQRDGSPHAGLVGGIAFGAAAAVGVARVVQRVHWTSDLPLAIAIGTWSGRTVQRHVGDDGRLGVVLRGLTAARGPGGRVRLGWSSFAR